MTFSYNDSIINEGIPIYTKLLALKFEYIIASGSFGIEGSFNYSSSLGPFEVSFLGLLVEAF